MKRRRRSIRRAQIHLPPLGAGYALTLVAIFEQAIAAIWRAHGESMAQLLELRHAATAQSRAPDWVDDGDPNAPDDTPF